MLHSRLLPALLLAAGALAQSPLTTTFNSSTFLAASGTVVYFDLDVRTAVQVTQMDVNFFGNAGLPVSITVWTRNGTHVGNNTSSSGWTQVGTSATVNSNGRNVATPCPFATPFTLTPGLTGVAVQHTGTGAAYTAGTSVGNVYASTAEMDFREGGSANPPIFVGTQNAPRVMNCSIHYQPLGGFAAATPYGSGCGGVRQFASYYQNFGASTFDLGGTVAAPRTLLHTPSGTGYVVVAGSGTWFPPQNVITVADETISPPQALGFTFTGPTGVVTNDVWISDNGYVWLTGAGRADFTPAANELLAEGPRLCPCWMALNPASGTIYFDSDPANGVAYVTWQQLAETGSAATITMQLAIYSNGSFEYRWADETIGTTSTSFALVGYSPGNGALDPGNTDISATPAILLQPDLVLPDLTLTSGRPVAGTTMTVTANDVPGGTAYGVLALSPTQLLPGLQPIGGLDSCVLSVGLDSILGFVPSGPSHVVNVAIPGAGFLGFTFHGQVLTLSPAVNPAGLASSNGITWRVDVN